MATKKATTTESTEVVEEVVKEVTKYTKDQIVASKRFRKTRDLVDALLDDGSMYTIDEVNEMLKAFKKGKVK